VFVSLIIDSKGLWHSDICYHLLINHYVKVVAITVCNVKVCNLGCEQCRPGFAALNEPVTNPLTGRVCSIEAF